ncbi:hypothetical protein EDD16DRAFT_1702267 [Pisolithus croceorrhizus]|nr:hypothetical protein EV401DRAFT_2073753 [Pisolithus croceorrhizus]KAI6127943.1 hypothetical protein EDD16DRAFT_1702267 [Pisolithus croceorrhizus]KAI6158549.1 hypothetical protein EDD17DRAFT_1763691 [Pisolithus thermaeus]
MALFLKFPFSSPPAFSFCSPDAMDSGKVPSPKFSHLFRFHPYARVKPSAREKLMATLYGDGNDTHPSDTERASSRSFSNFDTSSTIVHALNEIVNGPTSLAGQRRRLSVSSLTVDLALLAVHSRRPPTDQK